MRRNRRPSYTKLTDEALIDLYLNNGDERALNELLSRYLDKVYYFALSILKNQMDAEDAAMDILANIGEKLRKYDITNFSSWLMTVVRNECLSRLKNYMKNRIEDLSEKNDPGFMEFPIIEALDGRDDELEQLLKAVDELKDEQNRCIVAHYFLGLTYKEVASEEGFSVNQVKSYIQNGKRNLRLQLTK
ncbi:MAG: RNA polymerase sigma factor [Planctomycetota bacterium]|jgi:RNA polymerase sigma-70 factor (ECF subfamily)